MSLKAKIINSNSKISIIILKKNAEKLRLYMRNNKILILFDYNYFSNFFKKILKFDNFYVSRKTIIDFIFF